MERTIKIYTADVGSLTDTRCFQQLYDRVSPERRAKADRMRFEKDKCLSLGAGALLEAALAAEGVSDFTMTVAHDGKPRLKHEQSIHFNLSHSGTKVMCAVSDSEIGCDAEQIKEPDMKIAKRFFHPMEYEALMQCRDAESLRKLFFRYWTLKESFMKATGLGFQLPLDSFCVILKGSRIGVEQSVDTRAYHFRELDLNDGYKYAVCSVDKPFDQILISPLADLL